MSAFDDYIAARGQIAADIREVFGFSTGDMVYFAPRETPPNASAERYAVVALDEPIAVDYHSGGKPDSAILKQSWTFGISVRLKRGADDLRDDMLAQLAFAFVNKLHEPINYADVSSGHIVRSFDWHGGDVQDQWLTLEFKLELDVYERRFE